MCLTTLYLYSVSALCILSFILISLHSALVILQHANTLVSKYLSDCTWGTGSTRLNFCMPCGHAHLIGQNIVQHFSHHIQKNLEILKDKATQILQIRSMQMTLACDICDVIQHIDHLQQPMIQTPSTTIVQRSKNNRDGTIGRRLSLYKVDLNTQKILQPHVITKVLLLSQHVKDNK